MRGFKCNKCNLEILGSTKICQNCGSKAIEYIILEIFDNNHETIKKYLDDGFKIIHKKQIVEKTDERNFYGVEYELQKPI